jgi:hypothetical protein
MVNFYHNKPKGVSTTMANNNLNDVLTTLVGNEKQPWQVIEEAAYSSVGHEDCSGTLLLAEALAAQIAMGDPQHVIQQVGSDLPQVLAAFSFYIVTKKAAEEQ